MQQINTIGFIVYLDDTPCLVYGEIGFNLQKSSIINACVFIHNIKKTGEELGKVSEHIPYSL